MGKGNNHGTESNHAEREHLGRHPRPGVFTGTRVPVKTLFDYLKANHPLDNFLEQVLTFRQSHLSKRVWSWRPGKRGGKPFRGMRITVYDVLSYLAAGMSQQEILADFPYLTEADILASLGYAAAREQRTLVVQA